MTHAISAIGLVWYRDAAAFDAVRALCEDGHKLHRTYDEWLRAAEVGRKGAQAKGMRVVLAHLDQDDFPKWCKAEGLNLNADARNRYASWVAYRVVTGGRAE